MDERITLKDIKNKSKIDMDNMVEIKGKEVTAISDQAKIQERKEKVDQQNKLKENEIMEKVDERIAQIAVEKEVFNELKQQEIERRKAENEILDKEDSDFDIPDDFIDEVEDKKNYIVIEDDEDIHQEQDINKLNIQSDKLSLDNKVKGTIISNPDAFMPVEHDNIILDNEDFIDLDKKEEEIKDYITEKEIGYNDNEDHLDIKISADENVKNISFTKEESDEMYEACKQIIKKITKPNIHTDISSFKIGSAINPTNAIIAKNKDVAEHVLWNSKRTIAMEEFEGYETNLICSDYDYNRGMYAQVIERLTIFYKHIKSNKPKDLKTWLKNMPSSDLNHLWFAGYIASFKDANFSANQCTNCQAPFISEDISIRSMFKFENKEAEQKYNKLINSPDDSEYTIESKGYRISEQYLFMLRSPSVWNSDVEPLLLSEEFRTKYQSVLNLLKFIDKIYFIDTNKGELRPIDYWSSIGKDESNRNEKILRNKVRRYAKIITEELDVSEYNYLMSKISSILIEEDTDLVYQLPERKCPKCNKILPAVEQTAEQLLFTHHQQALLGNI